MGLMRVSWVNDGESMEQAAFYWGEKMGKYEKVTNAARNTGAVDADTTGL
jgi:hypothetical protein